MPAARRDYWHFVGGANIADPADPPLTALGVGGNLFGLDDLSELLTFYGLNDDRVLSRLERVTQGRFDSAVIADGTTRYGPLRANRPTALERRFHDDRINIINPNSGNAGPEPTNRHFHVNGKGSGTMGFADGHCEAYTGDYLAEHLELFTYNK